MLSFASLSDYIVSTAQRCGGGGLLLLERQEGHVVIRKLQPQVIIVLHMECVGVVCLFIWLNLGFFCCLQMGSGSSTA